jgi:hypothetical protein
MKAVFLCLLVGLFLSSVVEGGEIENLKNVDSLSEEFQRQMPWGREEREGYYPVIKQPEEYTAPAEKEEKQDQTYYYYYRHFICYNPHTGLYEYCPSTKKEYYFRLGIKTPGFYLYWYKGVLCPEGYIYLPEKGCQ